MATFPSAPPVAPGINKTSFARSIMRANALVLDGIAEVDSTRQALLRLARKELNKAFSDAHTPEEIAMVQHLMDYMLVLNEIRY